MENKRYSPKNNESKGYEAMTEEVRPPGANRNVRPGFLNFVILFGLQKM